MPASAPTARRSTQLRADGCAKIFREKVASEPANLLCIHALCVQGQVADLHVLDHAAAKRGHRRLLCEMNSATWRRRIFTRRSRQTRVRCLAVTTKRTRPDWESLDRVEELGVHPAPLRFDTVREPVSGVIPAWISSSLRHDPVYGVLSWRAMNTFFPPSPAGHGPCQPHGRGDGGKKRIELSRGPAPLAMGVA
jgi:hypothetical protein